MTNMTHVIQAVIALIAGIIFGAELLLMCLKTFSSEQKGKDDDEK